MRRQTNLPKRLSGSSCCGQRGLGKDIFKKIFFLQRTFIRLSCILNFSLGWHGAFHVCVASEEWTLHRFWLGSSGALMFVCSLLIGGEWAYVAALQWEGSWVLPAPWGQAMIHSQLSAVSRLLRHRSGARWILISCACRTFNYKAGNRCYSRHIHHSHKKE